METGRSAAQQTIPVEEQEEPPGLGPAFSSHRAIVCHQDTVRTSSARRQRQGRLVVRVSKRSKEFIAEFFPGTSLAEWSDWRWQLQNCVSSVEQLNRYLVLSGDEQAAVSRRRASLPLRITPYYLSLLDRYNAADPLRRSVVPVSAEFVHGPGESRDPLAEDCHSPVPGIVHRYPDRVLFLATTSCLACCRYCTRSRAVGNAREYQFNTKQWQRSLAYIEANPVIRDVLISGGDPLVLLDEQLEYLISQIRKIKHVEIIRIGTKAPVVLPQRITTGLLKMLKKYHPLWVSIHFAHPQEITPEVTESCSRLADAGVPLGSQTVLLQGINDSVETMKELVQGLMKIRVRPYYLYQCDPIIGSAHFRTPVEKGLEIIKGLRGFTSGYAVPSFVIDAPDGGGKIPLLPEYYLGRDGNNVLLRNYEGKVFSYPDPIVKP